MKLRLKIRLFVLFKIKPREGVLMNTSMRSILVLIIIASLPFLFLTSLSIGDADVGPQQVLNYFFGEKISSIDRLVIQDIRMPLSLIHISEPTRPY